MNSAAKQYLRIIIQVALGVLFVYSSGMKLFVSGLDTFLKDVENFKISFVLFGACKIKFLRLIPFANEDNLHSGVRYGKGKAG